MIIFQEVTQNSTEKIQLERDKKEDWLYKTTLIYWEMWQMKQEMQQNLNFWGEKLKHKKLILKVARLILIVLVSGSSDMLEF